MANCLNCIPHCCLYSLFSSLPSPSSLHCGLSPSPLLTTSPHFHSHDLLPPQHLSFRPLIVPFLISASTCVPSLFPPLCLFLPSSRLRLARMNEEMREAEAPLGQPGQYPSSSPTEQQYRKCIQEFICLTIDEC